MKRKTLIFMKSGGANDADGGICRVVFRDAEVEAIDASLRDLTAQQAARDLVVCRLWDQAAAIVSLFQRAPDEMTKPALDAEPVPTRTLVIHANGGERAATVSFRASEIAVHKLFPVMCANKVCDKADVLLRILRESASIDGPESEASAVPGGESK